MPEPALARPDTPPSYAPRVLIVEDEFLIALSAEHDLVAAGFTVTGKAASHDAALDLARTTRPDIILMDVRLGAGRDGIEAAITIRAALDIPVVFATASISPENMRRGEAARPAGWLAKPYGAGELVAALKIALAAAGRPVSWHGTAAKAPLGTG